MSSTSAHLVPLLDIDLTLPFPVLENDLILRTARGERTERVTVWCMRQAGRYLPEFRKVREQIDFFGLCRNPEMACEVTLQPIRRFALDAAIIFSDILVVLQALGLEVQMVKAAGPHLPNPLVDPSELKKVSEGGRLPDKVDVYASLGYVLDAIRLTRHSLKGKVPLLGFSGAPFTLMAYAVEGGSSKSFVKVKRWLCKYPNESHILLHQITDICIDYLVAQAEAGAQMLQIFDSWANELSPEHFDLFSKPYLNLIQSQVKQRLEVLGLDVPLCLFARGYGVINTLPDFHYDVISIDWTIDPKFARSRSNDQVFQGNLEPCLLFASEEDLRANVRKMIDAFGTQKYIANLGHGMLPEHDPNSVSIFIDEIRTYSLSKNV